MKIKLYALALLTLLTIGTKAQDAHYWSTEFSPGSFLFPGASVANVKDSGVFSYNPALLAIHPKNSVSISANLYELELVRLKDGVGKDLNLSSTKPRIVPQMVSGTLKLNNKLAVGYALLQNTLLDYSVDQRKDGQQNVLDDRYSPGNEFYTGTFQEGNRTSQTVGMGSIGMRLSPQWSVGLNVEGNIRTQQYSRNTSSSAFITQATGFGPFESLNYSYNSSYTHIGMRFKAGVAYDNGRHHIGFLVSSPLLSVKGYGSVQADLSLSNIMVANTQASFDTVNLLGSARQTDVKVKYKLPFSVAAGYAYDYGSGQISLTAEYFNKIDNYDIYKLNNSGPFIRPDTGYARYATYEFLKFTETKRSVVNFGLGVNHIISDKVTAFLAFRTDYSYYKFVDDKSSDFVSPTAVNWDVYHLQLGGNFRRRKFNLRAGLLFSYGRTGAHEQPFNFDTVKDSNLMTGTSVYAGASYFKAGLMMSYVYNL